ARPQNESDFDILARRPKVLSFDLLDELKPLKSPLDGVESRFEERANDLSILLDGCACRKTQNVSVVDRATILRIDTRHTSRCGDASIFIRNNRTTDASSASYHADTVCLQNQLTYFGADIYEVVQCRVLGVDIFNVTEILQRLTQQ